MPTPELPLDANEGFLHTIFFLSLLAACTDKVASDADAELAYLGLDAAVERGLALGFDGFNAASSANIDDQTEDGASSGSMVISGQVDQGESDNKGMRLFMSLTNYSDTLGDDGEPDLLYATDATDLPALNLQLKGIPDGTLDGTLVGTFAMLGLLDGTVDLNLTFSGTLESNGADGTQRAAGSTAITGTATSDYGTYTVDLVR